MPGNTRLKTPSVKVNVIFNTFYEILKILTPFITAPYLSRVLGAEKIGISSFTSSVRAYFDMFAVLGTVSYGSREIARTRDDRYLMSKTFWEIELQSIITSSIAITGWIIFIFNTNEYKIYYTILTVGLFSTMFDISWLYSGCEQYKNIVIRNTIVKITEIVLIFIFVKTSDDLWKFILLNTVSGLLGTLSLWTLLPHYICKVKIRELRVFRHLKNTIKYFLPTIASSVYLVLDKTLLGLITKNEAENGYYEQANKVISLLKSLTFNSINGVMGVRISYLFAQKKLDEAKERLEKTLNFMMFMALGCCLGMMGISDNFTVLFFGDGYDKVSTLIKLSCPLVVIVSFSVCLSSCYYRPAGYILKITLFTSAGAAVNLLCNLLLIPHLQSVGAIIGTIVAETVISILYIIFCKSFLTIKTIAKVVWKKLIASLVMYLVVCYLGKINLAPLFNLIIQVVSGAIIYFGLLIILRDKYTLRTIRELFLNIKKRFVRHDS